MSVKVDEKIVTESMRERCVRCVKGPNLIRTLILAACIGLVVEQMTSCVRKIINIPITTYTHFEFNKTLLYPSVTLCREPAYKFDMMEMYGLYGHPYYTSLWRNFNFTNDLDKFWDDVTYTLEDYFVMYGLDSSVDKVKIEPVDGLIHGRCYTVSPEVLVTAASRASGYSLTLQHTARDLETNTGIYPPGYHVFIHYWKEPFTEVQVRNGGLVEYMYLHTGEEVDVKLTVDEYVKISDELDPCTYRANYSANDCTTLHVSKLIDDEVSCSAPWMKSDLPRCDNFTKIRNHITSYMSNYQDHQYMDCPRFCRSYLYKAFVTNRQNNYLWDVSTKQWTVRGGEAALQTQLYIHFNSMMVAVYEERYNYDWNLFLSDLGGSVGFLLGISVISIAKIFSNLCHSVAKHFKSSKSIKDNNSVSNSAAKIKHQDLQEPADDVESNKSNYVWKCNEWNSRNEGLV